MRKLILTMFILFLLLVGTISNAAEVTLQWGASIDVSYLFGYRIYMSDTQGQYVLVSENPTTNNMVGDVGKDVLTFTITVPDEAGKYWFVVTAYNNLESEKSNEVYCNIVPRPAPPNSLQIISSDCMGDLNFDGDVDGNDLTLFSKDFGRTDCSGRQ